MPTDHPLGRLTADLLSYAAIAGSAFHYVPEVMSIPGGLWCCIQIYSFLRGRK
jgi:hypothetical protein